VLSVPLQALVLYASLINALFHTVLLPLAALAGLVLWAGELRRLAVRWRAEGGP
jgi:hypothetical protein